MENSTFDAKHAARTDMSDHTPPPTRNAERKAVALFLFTLALIAAFVVYVMTARGVFEETQRLVLIADNSEGVRSGMDLGFSGFPIGRVNRVELADDGRVRILIDVPTKDARWLRTSSVFTLERSLVGDARLRAFSALLDDPPLPPGAERPVLRGDAGEQIPQVTAAAKALLENLERLSAPGSPLDATLGHVESVTSRMRGRHGALGGLLGSEENAGKLIAALERTNTLLEKADARVFGRGGMMDESQAAVAQLHALLRESRASLKKADAILANVEGASTDLVALRAEVEASLRKTTQLIDEINRKWPFARDTEIKLP
ncbi:MAG: mammalian cell entry protein [Rhodocyclaceae bacterium]|nr:mammalian cell entry protein [Rhodocyclaceae bacterium]